MPPAVGKFLVVLGLVLAGVGALIWLTPLGNWLGRLPGDVNYQGERFSFHFPWVTCLVLSAVLSFILWLLRR